MARINNFLRNIKNNIFQFIFAAVCLGLAVFFVIKQKQELIDAFLLMKHTRGISLMAGMLFTALFIVCQSMMYQHSFKVIGKKITFKACLKLYLKRNIASVFLPGGGITCLAFFKDEIEREGATKPQIYFSSIIYGFCGILTFFLISIPILGYAVIKNSYGSSVYYSFAALTGMLISLGLIINSIYQEGIIYKFIVKKKPSFALTISELKSQPFHLNHFILINIYSFIIEVIGIIHLYIAMLALELPTSLEASLIAYVVSGLFLTVSPFMRGLGGIEIGMVYVLTLYGYTTVQGLSITLLFRCFEFWFILIAGIFAFIEKRKMYKPETQLISK